MEDIDFKYTTISLNKVYSIGFKHALENVERNGGKVQGDKVIIPIQKPATVKFEQSFTGLYPIDKIDFNKDVIDTSFSFEGTGFILRGAAFKKNEKQADYVFEAELFIDGIKVETAKLPTNYTIRRNELFWKYPLPKGKHTVQVKVLNPDDNYYIHCDDYIIYSDKPSGSKK